MLKRYLIAGTLALTPWIGQSQKPPDSLTQKVDQTAIELVYNHYLQDGDNSAVTGGRGTEKLSVFGPSVAVSWNKDRQSTSLQLGADIISSASTDRIDFIRSSASAHDTHAFANLSYERQLEPDRLSAYGGGGFSIESDYFSLAGRLGLRFDQAELGRSFQVEASLFKDDLRWGRLDKDFYSPQFLIYPQELRYREWFDTYRRTTVNVKMGFSQILNTRQVLGIYPELSVQTGLLATPFHRVYFTDGTVGVEQVPDQRLKAALGIKLNSAAGERIVFKHSVDGYADSFDLFALGLRHEMVYRFSPFLALGYSLRFYHQNGASFFHPYAESSRESRFHTSDFDLSTFQTYSAGAVLKYFPFQLLGKQTSMEAVIFRYRYLHRSNGLEAHILTVSINLLRDKFKSQ